MNARPNFNSPSSHLPRRAFLADCGMGFTGLVLGAMLHQDGIVRAAEPSPDWLPPDGKPHFAPKAKNVIWLFMNGGVSHLESFDPKPALNKYGGKTIEESPFNDAVVNSPYYLKNVRDVVSQRKKLMATLFPLQVGFRKRGQCGIEVSDWWPHLSQCIDDMAVVRSVWTTDDDHGAQLQFHTGRHFFEGNLPTIGAWAHYGLGSLNDNLPQFVVLGGPPNVAKAGAHGADYLGPQYGGITLGGDPKNPLPFGTPGAGVYFEERKSQLELVQDLNRLTAAEYPADSDLRARVKAYELAFGMQTAVPEVMNFGAETQATHRLYGLDQGTTRPLGQRCLTARRLVERGVRFVQIYHGGLGDDGSWDSHFNMKTMHGKMCRQADKPIAALLKDLKQRDLLDETLVVWGTEFGRTPGGEDIRKWARIGRDHHPYGFSVWMAGGGIKGGIAHGATDEIGFHAVENRHYVTDIHATVLHQLGLDPRRLEVPGHKRLEIDFGKPIQEIIA